MHHTRTTRAILAGVIMLGALFSSGTARLHASEPENPGRDIGQAFAGEELVYDIGFWFFKDVAQGRLVLRGDGPGAYVATLTARTSGVIDRILRHRRDRYVAKLRLSEDGARFVTESFEKVVEMDGKGQRRSIHKVDYGKRTVTWRSWGGGKEEKTGTAEIPEGMYADDPIAAFYNFRFGVYGQIREGREYSILSFKDERFPEIYIRMATEKELNKRRSRGMTADLLAYARIDKDLFGSNSGDLEILFTKGMLPVQAVAKDILFFGDVKGRLREVNQAEGPRAQASPK